MNPIQMIDDAIRVGNTQDSFYLWKIAHQLCWIHVYLLLRNILLINTTDAIKTESSLSNAFF